MDRSERTTEQWRLLSSQSCSRVAAGCALRPTSLEPPKAEQMLPWSFLLRLRFLTLAFLSWFPVKEVNEAPTSTLGEQVTAEHSTLSPLPPWLGTSVQFPHNFHLSVNNFHLTPRTQHSKPSWPGMKGRKSPKAGLTSERLVLPSLPHTTRLH